MVSTNISGSNDSNSMDFQKRSNLSEVVTLIGGWALTAIYSATTFATGNDPLEPGDSKVEAGHAPSREQALSLSSRVTIRK